MAEAKDAAAVAAKLNKEIAELDALNSKPFLLSAPGLYQTHGPRTAAKRHDAGSGQRGGLGVGRSLVRLQTAVGSAGSHVSGRDDAGALSNVVLSKGERPITSFSREMGGFGKFIVFFWILGTIMSSVIWHFPQYGLAAAAARDLVNNLGNVAVSVPEADAADTAMGLGFTTAGLAISIGVGVCHPLHQYRHDLQLRWRQQRRTASTSGSSAPASRWSWSCSASSSSPKSA